MKKGIILNSMIDTSDRDFDILYVKIGGEVMRYKRFKCRWEVLQEPSDRAIGAFCQSSAETLEMLYQKTKEEEGK